MSEGMGKTTNSGDRQVRSDCREQETMSESKSRASSANTTDASGQTSLEEKNETSTEKVNLHASQNR